MDDIHDTAHDLDIRVYYEDTDLGGIVYYANYFRFIERGRTELLRDAGIDQVALKDETGVVFAVRRIGAEFLAPAKMDDMLRVLTRVTDLGRARITMAQQVLRGDQVLFEADVTLACIGPGGRATRIPPRIAALMAPR